MQAEFVRGIIINAMLSAFVFILFIDCIRDVRVNGGRVGRVFPKWLLVNTIYYFILVLQNIVLLVSGPEVLFRIVFALGILMKELAFVPFTLWILDMINERMELPAYTNRIVSIALSVTADFLGIWALFFGGDIYELASQEAGFVLYICMYARTLILSGLLVMLILFSYKTFNTNEIVLLILYSVFPSVSIPIPKIAGITVESLATVIIILVIYARIWHSRRKHYEERELELEKSRTELAEAKLNLMRNEKAADDSKVKIMISQIQPHFIYNALSSISALCVLDPEKAGELTSKFARYLRANLSSLNSDSLVDFDRELEHTKFYLDVELTRFPDRLKVIYDIGPTDFNLPVLTLQPLVENAVAHGICEKLDGGTIWIKTAKDENGYYVYIINDGSGFDANVDSDSEIGYAISNVRNRLEILSGAALTIEGRIEGGTEVTIFVPRER